MKKGNWEHAFIYFFALICILPLLFMIFYSFKQSNGSYGIGQYIQALFLTEDFFVGFWNSFLYTVLIILFNVPISLLTAYGMYRFQFKGKDVLHWFYIVLMLMPFQATIVPQYITLKALSLINNPLSVILPNIFATYGSVLMIQHLSGMSKELIDAGRIEGLSERGMFLKIVVPISKPLIYALTVLLFINYWSMVEQPIVFIDDFMDMPLSVTLNNSMQFQGVSYAIGVLFSVLPLLLYQLTYRDIIYGIGLSSGVKGMTNHTNKKNHFIVWALCVFISFLLVCSFVTDKLTYFLRPTVEVQTAVSKDLKSIDGDAYSPSLGYYTYVVPTTAVHNMGGEHYIYLIENDKSSGERLELVRVQVSVNAENQREAAISGRISSESLIVVRYDKPLTEMQYVKVYKWGGSHE